MEKPDYLERVMPWTTNEDLKIFENVDLIRQAIRANNGILIPQENTRALAIMSNFYRIMCEKAGKAKAMRDEYFAELLKQDMAIGRAEGLSKGSEFGQKRTYYQAVADGYLEVINALKKINEYHENTAKGLI